MPKLHWKDDPRNEWITTELLDNYLAEVEGDSMRNAYLSEGKSCQRYYNTINDAYASTDTEDIDLSEDLRKSGITSSIENHIKRAVDDIVSLSFKNDPEVKHHPQMGRPEDSQLTDDMDALLRMAWKKATVRPAMISWGQQAVIWGLSTVKVIWNPADRSRGDGDVAVINKSPFDIMFDPLASNSNRGLDVRYIIDRSFVPPETIARRFGEEGILAAGIDPSKWFDRLVDKIPFEKLKKMIVVSKNRKKGEDYTNTILEYWLFPSSKYDNAITGGDDMDELDYPYGVVVTYINGKIVDIKDNPFCKKDKLENSYGKAEDVIRGHHRHPFVPMWWLRCHNVDGYNSFYMTRGAVSAGKPAQTSLFGLTNSAEIITRVNGRPPIVVRDGVTKEPLRTINGQPGEVITITNEWESTPLENLIQFRTAQQMSPDIPMLINRKEEKIGKLMGVNMGMVGQYPGAGGSSHTTAQGTNVLVETSFTPMWTPTKELDDAIKDLAELIMGNIQQFYKAGRYEDISTDGEQISVQLSEAHLKTQFQRIVISGATTPMYDIDRDPRMANIKLMVDQAIIQSLETKDVSFMETCVIYLEAIKYPPALQFIQLLKAKIAELEQGNQMQDTAIMQGGAVSLADQLAQAQAMTQGEGQPLAEENPDELEQMAALFEDE